MPEQRPYATQFAKGEDRRQRILAVAGRLLSRQGWRSTSLSQIAREAGVTTAGLLHHFESKEQLLHAVLEQRDTFDDVNADLEGDLIKEIAKTGSRYESAPDQLGTFIVLMVENADPAAPLHGRLLSRHNAAHELVADLIRRGQAEGRYRSDVDPAVKAVEIIAFVNGMETSWLLDPSTPLVAAFQEYASSLALRLAPPRPGES
jgi:AcrR family transcriptional regulator